MANRIVRLTEADITRLVRRVINENIDFDQLKGAILGCLKKDQIKLPSSCSSIDRLSSTNTNELKPCLAELKKIASTSSKGDGVSSNGYSMGLATNNFRFCVKNKTNVDLLNIGPMDFTGM